MAGSGELDVLAIPVGSGGIDPCGDTDDAARPDADERGGERGMAEAVRDLALLAVKEAGVAETGLGRFAGAMAGVAAGLWGRALRFDAADPRWPDRDRVVLSAGHGAPLLYAVLSLTGHAGMGRDALDRFGQLDSPAAGMPEHGEHPAIEATTGAPGQGVAMAVGMALAERMLAARFGRSLVDHRTWVLADDADMVQGVSQEAACLAGQLRLERLTVLWADETADGVGEEVLKRFAAAGWSTKRIDAAGLGEVAAALGLALRSRKPTLVACRGGGEVFADAAAVPEGAEDAWLRAGSRGTGARRAWLKRMANHPLRGEFERVTAGRLPESWHEATGALRSELADSRPGWSTLAVGRRTAALLAGAVPELVGAEDGEAVSAGSYAGRQVPFMGRAQLTAACCNGMALHGGLVPCAAGPLVATDEMRPALRLAAQMRQRVILLLDGDSIGVGAAGAPRQPVEQLAGLRAMPGLTVLRPADAVEAAECWELAVRRADGPSLLVLCDRAVPALRTDAAENRSARGGYVLAEADGPRTATLIASGSEVAVAMDARRLLAAEGIPVAVVSMPCWELFAAQDESTRAPVLGTALRVGIEAACGFGWERWLGPDGVFIGMRGYGASAPPDVLYRHFGITPEAIAAAVRKRMPQPSPSEGI